MMVMMVIRNDDDDDDHDDDDDDVVFGDFRDEHKKSMGMLRQLSELSGYQLPSRPSGGVAVNDERGQAHQSELPFHDDGGGQLPPGVLQFRRRGLCDSNSSEQFPRGMFPPALLPTTVQAGRHRADMQHKLLPQVHSLHGNHLPMRCV